MNIGKTDRFPQGKLSEDDEGELAFRIAADPIKNVIIIDFGTPVKWLGFPNDYAIGLANLILKRAEELK